MSANQPTTGGGGDTRVVFTGAQRNPLLTFLQRPRIVLLLLAAWSILSVLTQIFTNSGLFLEDHKPGKLDMDGALGGLAFGWEGIPLAAVYLYCFRDPVKHRLVFWLALIQLAALAVSQIYHWGYGNFTPESIVIPLAVSGGLALLVFLHLFGPKEQPAVATAAPD